MDYIIKYTDPNTNQPEYIEAESIEDFARKRLFYHIYQRKDGGWEIWLRGRNVAHYTNEWTQEEAEKDYFKDFTRKNNWKNIQYYHKI